MSFAFGSHGLIVEAADVQHFVTSLFPHTRYFQEPPFTHAARFSDI